jgi:hypothetical protein
MRPAMRPLRLLLATSFVLSGVLVGTAESGAAPPGTSAPAHWSIQPSAIPGGAVASSFAAVSCSGGDACEAVGEYSDGTVNRTLAERWDGSAWRVEATPNPSGATFNQLTGVSCVRRRRCAAVGISISSAGVVHALAEHRSGNGWRLDPTPVPPRAFWDELVTVSCLTADDCTAVGGFIKSGPDDQEQPLAEHWDGTAWSLEHAPNPHAENGSSMNGVSCLSQGTCEGVGSYVFGDVDQAVLAFGWDGSTWTRQHEQDPGGGETSDQSFVACSTPAACTAVGTWADARGVPSVLAERWNGSRWSMQGAVDPPDWAAAHLSGVSCPSDRSCTAVGSWSTSANDFPELTLAERWNGARWRIEATPNPSGSDLSALTGIDCTGVGRCVAVGGCPRRRRVRDARRSPLAVSGPP